MLDLREMQEAARQYAEVTAAVKRAVEGLKDQPKKGVMPWEKRRA